MILGVDYASVDGNARPDLAAARAAGIRFAFIRAAYAAWQDPTCARDRDAIRAAGMTLGAYLFPLMAASNPSPEVQVKAALAGASLIPGKDLPLVLDIEFPQGLAGAGRTRPEAAAWIARAVAAVRQETGVDPMIYSSQRVLDGTDGDALAGAADDAIRGCPLWMARYPYKTRIPAVLSPNGSGPPVPRVAGDADDWHCWQYQGDAVHLPGFSATVDLDRWNPLRRGVRGARVLWAQRRLRIAEGTPAVWDDAMDGVVMEWQARHGLEPDGIIGPGTFASLAWRAP